MPRGVARAGGGRPKRAQGRKAAQTAPLPVPGHLSDEERRVWAQWEPLARNMRTLTTETVPSFEMLCKVAVEVDALREVLRRANFLHPSGLAHPLSTGYRQMVLRLEQLMARFGLAPQGRPVVIPDADPKATPSKWDGLLSEDAEDAEDAYGLGPN